MTMPAPYTVTNSYKSGLFMKTYARSIRRIWDGEDVPVAKKQRIEQKKAPAAKSSPAAPTPGTSDENIQRAIRETSVAVSSSPSRKNSAIFSTSDAHTDETITPPSSPPPPQLTPPVNTTRKPTFNFLKRKRDAESNGTSREESEPLAEVVNNSSTVRAQSTAPPVQRPHQFDRKPSQHNIHQAERRKSHHDAHPLTTKSHHPKSAKTPQTPTFPSLVKTPSIPKPLTQTTLDLGAETRKTCRECEMSYVPSNPEDVNLHRMWHDRDTEGLDLGKALQKGSAMRWAYEVPHIEGIVVVVDRKTSAPARAQTKRVLEIVGRELGSVGIEENVLWSQKVLKGGRRGSANAADGDEMRSDRFKVFLHIKDGKCVGLCLAERITEAHPVQKYPSSAQEHMNGDATVKSVSIEIDPRVVKPAVVGISRIWTSKSFRRKGIATNLLDCVMNNFIYGMEIEREEIAFSQPTESGGGLARAWFGAEGGWCVYDEA